MYQVPSIDNGAQVGKEASIEPWHNFFIKKPIQ